MHVEEVPAEATAEATAGQILWGPYAYVSVSTSHVEPLKL